MSSKLSRVGKVSKKKVPSRRHVSVISADGSTSSLGVVRSTESLQSQNSKEGLAGVVTTNPYKNLDADTDLVCQRQHVSSDDDSSGEERQPVVNSMEQREQHRVRVQHSPSPSLPSVVFPAQSFQFQALPSQQQFHCHQVLDSRDMECRLQELWLTFTKFKNEFSVLDDRVNKLEVPRTVADLTIQRDLEKQRIHAMTNNASGNIQTCLFPSLIHGCNTDLNMTNFTILQFFEFQYHPTAFLLHSHMYNLIQGKSYMTIDNACRFFFTVYNALYHYSCSCTEGSLDKCAEPVQWKILRGYQVLLCDGRDYVSYYTFHVMLCHLAYSWTHPSLCGNNFWEPCEGLSYIPCTCSLRQRRTSVLSNQNIGTSIRKTSIGNNLSGTNRMTFPQVSVCTGTCRGIQTSHILDHSNTNSALLTTTLPESSSLPMYKSGLSSQSLSNTITTNSNTSIVSTTGETRTLHTKLPSVCVFQWISSLFFEVSSTKHGASLPNHPGSSIAKHATKFTLAQFQNISDQITLPYPSCVYAMKPSNIQPLPNNWERVIQCSSCIPEYPNISFYALVSNIDRNAMYVTEALKTVKAKVLQKVPILLPYTQQCQPYEEDILKNVSMQMQRYIFLSLCISSILVKNIKHTTSPDILPLLQKKARFLLLGTMSKSRVSLHTSQGKGSKPVLSSSISLNRANTTTMHSHPELKPKTKRGVVMTMDALYQSLGISTVTPHQRNVYLNEQTALRHIQGLVTESRGVSTITNKDVQFIENGIQQSIASVPLRMHITKRHANLLLFREKQKRKQRRSTDRSQRTTISKFSNILLTLHFNNFESSWKNKTIPQEHVPDASLFQQHYVATLPRNVKELNPAMPALQTIRILEEQFGKGPEQSLQSPAYLHRRMKNVSLSKMVSAENPSPKRAAVLKKADVKRAMSQKVPIFTLPVKMPEMSEKSSEGPEMDVSKRLQLQNMDTTEEWREGLYVSQPLELHKSDDNNTNSDAISDTHSDIMFYDEDNQREHSPTSSDDSHAPAVLHHEENHTYIEDIINNLNDIHISREEDAKDVEVADTDDRQDDHLDDVIISKLEVLHPNVSNSVFYINPSVSSFIQDFTPTDDSYGGTVEWDIKPNGTLNISGTILGNGTVISKIGEPDVLKEPQGLYTNESVPLLLEQVQNNDNTITMHDNMPNSTPSIMDTSHVESRNTSHILYTSDRASNSPSKPASHNGSNVSSSTYQNLLTGGFKCPDSPPSPQSLANDSHPAKIPMQYTPERRVSSRSRPSRIASANSTSKYASISHAPGIVISQEIPNPGPVGTFDESGLSLIVPGRWTPMRSVVPDLNLPIRTRSNSPSLSQRTHRSQKSSQKSPQKNVLSNNTDALPPHAYSQITPHLLQNLNKRHSPSVSMTGHPGITNVRPASSKIGNREKSRRKGSIELYRQNSSTDVHTKKNHTEDDEEEGLANMNTHSALNQQSLDDEEQYAGRVVNMYGSKGKDETYPSSVADIGESIVDTEITTHDNNHNNNIDNNNHHHNLDNMDNQTEMTLERESNILNLKDLLHAQNATSFHTSLLNGSRAAESLDHVTLSELSSSQDLPHYNFFSQQQRASFEDIDSIVTEAVISSTLSHANSHNGGSSERDLSVPSSFSAFLARARTTSRSQRRSVNLNNIALNTANIPYLHGSSSKIPTINEEVLAEMEEDNKENTKRDREKVRTLPSIPDLPIPLLTMELENTSMLDDIKALKKISIFPRLHSFDDPEEHELDITLPAVDMHAPLEPLTPPTVSKFQAAIGKYDADYMPQAPVLPVLQFIKNKDVQQGNDVDLHFRATMTTPIHITKHTVFLPSTKRIMSQLSKNQQINVSALSTYVNLYNNTTKVDLHKQDTHDTKEEQVQRLHLPPITASHALQGKKVNQKYMNGTGQIIDRNMYRIQTQRKDINQKQR